MNPLLKDWATRCAQKYPTRALMELLTDNAGVRRFMGELGPLTVQEMWERACETAGRLGKVRDLEASCGISFPQAPIAPVAPPEPPEPTFYPLHDLHQWARRLREKYPKRVQLAAAASCLGVFNRILRHDWETVVEWAAHEGKVLLLVQYTGIPVHPPLPPAGTDADPPADWAQLRQELRETKEELALLRKNLKELAGDLSYLERTGLARTP